MHEIEPFYQWRDYYISEEDRWSPYYRKQYDEFNFTNTIYNYLIHPQWDYFGSDTMFIKILFANYQDHYAIIEMIGEWNDCIGNDIMFLKRDILDVFIEKGVYKFILIAENVLNFHYEMDDYYAELHEDTENGWIVMIGLHEHVLTEFKKYHLDNYIVLNEQINDLPWRIYNPETLIAEIEQIIEKNQAI